VDFLACTTDLYALCLDLLGDIAGLIFAKRL